MERRKRAMFCSLAAMVLATALVNAVHRPSAEPRPTPLRLSIPAQARWIA